MCTQTNFLQDLLLNGKKVNQIIHFSGHRFFKRSVNLLGADNTNVYINLKASPTVCISCQRFTISTDHMLCDEIVYIIIQKDTLLSIDYRFFDSLCNLTGYVLGLDVYVRVHFYQPFALH